MNKKYEEKINNMLSELNEVKEELRKTNEFKKEIGNKFRRFVVFMVSLCLILSGITGVASYSLGANQVGYTPKDTTWTVQNTGDAIDELRDNIGASLVGSIFSYMGTTAPYGYLACDGSEYNIADYPRLANHINAHFGSTNYFGGDGTTTFAVPDLRGEFLRGTGTNSHANQGSGASVGTHQDGSEHFNLRIENNGNNIYSSWNSDEFVHNKDSEYGGNGYIRGISRNGSISIADKLYYTSRPTNTSVLYIIKY